MANKLEIFMTGQHFKKLCEKNYEKIISKYSINKTEIDILFFLDTTSYDTAKDIVNIRHISKSHVSNAIDHLCSLGYLISTPDENDHRKIRLTISEKAAPLINSIQRLHQNLSRVVFHGITEDEKQVMQHVVEKMIHNISTALDKPDTLSPH